MFGKMFNQFYYGKSGKGDFRKEDRPKNRWQLFWEMLKIRFSALIRLNLMYAVPWLPAMVVMVMGALALVTGLNQTMEGQGVEGAKQALALFQGTLTTTMLLLIPCITLTGPFTAGVAYVTRNWSRDEHAFIWADFKDAIKSNWKQSLVISFVTSLVPILVYVCWVFYGQMAQNSPLMVIPQVMTLMLGVIWFLGLTYFYPLIVSYQLRMRDVFRNGLLLTIARLPFSVAIRLGLVLPAAVALLIMYVGNPAWAILGLFLYYLLFGFAFSRFVTASYTNGVFDRYINSQIAGAEINRGLSLEQDEDDDDAEEDVQE